MSSTGENTIRYAPYLEKIHRLNTGVDVEAPLYTMQQAMNAAFFKSPYKTGIEFIDPNRGYFGVVEGAPERAYKLEDFPSLWDMFGKFMGGLDLHLLWGDVYEDVVHGPEIADSITAHSALLRDEIDSKVLPSFLAGMRDINAIQSTTFVIGKAVIYDTHTKAVSEFGGALRIAALDLSYKIWFKHLDWSTSVVTVYDGLFKSYFEIKLENDIKQLEYKVKDVLWDLGLFDYARSFIGALNGASAMTGKNEPSQATKALGGALSGAAAGTAISPGWGTAIGAAVGLGASFM